MKKIIRLTESDLTKLVKRVVNEITQDDFTRKFNNPESKRGSGELVKIVSRFDDGDVILKGIMGQHEDGRPWFMPIEDGVDFPFNIRMSQDSLTNFIHKYNKLAREERKLPIESSSNYLDDTSSIKMDANWNEDGIMIGALSPFVLGRGTKIIKI
jgi:hypothetical protein